MILYWYYDTNIYAENILYLLTKWDVEDCMCASSKLYMREYSALKYHINNTDNPMYMESLSGENTEE